MQTPGEGEGAHRGCQLVGADPAALCDFKHVYAVPARGVPDLLLEEDDAGEAAAAAASCACCAVLDVPQVHGRDAAPFVVLLAVDGEGVIRDLLEDAEALRGPGPVGE